MKNAIKVLCFVIAVLIAGSAAWYFAFVWDMNEFVFIDGTEKGTVIITGYIGSDKDVEIPKTLRAKKVVGIDNYAFRDTDISSVKVGDNVRWIGDGAFNGCKNLKSVDLGKSVETLGREVFVNSTGLTVFKFSPALKEIGQLLFGNNTKITDLNLNGNLNFKFENGIIYSSDMSVIYESLISADLSDYEMPKSVVELRPYAFYSQEEIKTIKLNSGIKSVPDGCFASCKGLTELSIPDSVESIGKLIIVNSSISTITIPSSVTKIDDLSFNHNDVPALDDEGKPVLDENGKEVTKPAYEVTIITVEGSFATTFARRNEIQLKIVDSL